MALTYTAPAVRDAARAVIAARRFETTHLLFLMTSAVCALAIGLSYLGRVATLAPPAGAGTREPVLLVPGQRAEALEEAFSVLLPAVQDRRFASRELAAFLDARREPLQPLDNVAAILAVRVPVDRVDRATLVLYAERLRRARASAASANRPAPTDLPLVTSADLTVLKPRFAVRTADTFQRTVIWWLAAYFLAFYTVIGVWRLRGVDGDRVLLAAAHLLTALGFALLLSRADPLRDSLPIVRSTQGVLVGLASMAAVSWLKLATAPAARFVYLPLLAAVSLSGLLLVFGDGPGTSAAKVNLGPIQPIEVIRLLMALFLAGYFARRWELIRETRVAPDDHRLRSAFDVPRVGYVIPVVAGVATALLLFFLQRDLGPALFLAFMFLALYAVARGRWPMAALGVAVLVAGFALGYRWRVSATLASRVEMWRSPWDNFVAGGDQVSQSLWALATGGAFGSGLGLGDTRYIPAGQNDLILAAAGEELGLLGILAIALVFTVVAWRGFSAAQHARDDHGFFLATSLTLFLLVPVLVMAAGILGVIPLTGVVTPFLSYGGSAMAANFTALGLLAGLRRADPSTTRVAPADLYRPFRGPMTVLSAVIGVCAVGLAARFAYVQVIAADDYAVRAYLGPQDDGVRRYQYNPRVLNVVREIPRGTVYDRAGLPLATDDARVVSAARQTYKTLGIDVSARCQVRDSRCYPLGAGMFHVLGDSTTRLNWSASNTAYVERDQEARLRGFDDRAASVPSVDAEGRRLFVLRRDYHAVLPLLRHRHERDHPAVQALLGGDRDLRLTVDARLQHRLASLLASYSRRSSSGKAAAVVLDPASGKILGLASYPWPALDSAVPIAADGQTRGDGSLLDRSRFGSYPPGSAFKLVTATAALRRDLRLAQEQFSCSGLPNGRVGVRIPGGRAVRDDVLDRHPHGTIAMHDGLVQSCNAYFAQLALKLGPEALLDTAARFGISVVSSSTGAARLRATLPEAGYGQGEVLTSPLRMARVAAAIADGGMLRDTTILERGARRGEERLLTPDAAGVLARYMRDAVVTGTGRVLRGHPVAIAGKTGTAEVAGAASHSWFVGFAPYGPASRRIAFAVLVENAGYGGQAAASLAGEIVTAATSIGLVK